MTKNGVQGPWLWHMKEIRLRVEGFCKECGYYSRYQEKRGNIFKQTSEKIHIFHRAALVTVKKKGGQGVDQDQVSHQLPTDKSWGGALKCGLRLERSLSYTKIIFLISVSENSYLERTLWFEYEMSFTGSCLKWSVPSWWRYLKEAVTVLKGGT